MSHFILCSEQSRKVCSCYLDEVLLNIEYSSNIGGRFPLITFKARRRWKEICWCSKYLFRSANIISIGLATGWGRSVARGLTHWENYIISSQFPPMTHFQWKSITLSRSSRFGIKNLESIYLVWFKSWMEIHKIFDWKLLKAQFF